jgi:hypothetical protein
MSPMEMLTTSIESVAGVPVLLVNGAPTAPVILCGVPDSEPDMLAETARLMGREGIHLYTAFVDFVWAATPVEEEAQRAKLDAMMRRLVAADPQALFMPRFGTEPKWWVAAHPEEAAVWAGGHVAEEASMASARWMAELKPKLAAYVRWFEEAWGDHVFGYQPCACGESYFMYWGIHLTGVPPISCVSPVLARGRAGPSAGRLSVRFAWRSGGDDRTGDRGGQPCGG